MKVIHGVPWHSLRRTLLPTSLLIVTIGLAEFIYLWLGQHLSLLVILDWLRSQFDRLLG